MTNKEAMQMALDALDCIYSPLHVREINKVGEAMAALRAALAQGEQEPVADGIQVIEHVRNVQYKIKSRYHLENGTELYTAPPQREYKCEWVGLTDEELYEALTAKCNDGSEPTFEEFKQDGDLLVMQAIARAVEAKLKEKNT